MENILFQKDQRVWWNDPEKQTSSYYTIISDVQQDIEQLQAQGGDERTIYSDLIIRLKNEQGSEIEALLGELEYAYEGTYLELVTRENELHQDMQSCILHHIRHNGGRISLTLPKTNEEREHFEFPVTSTLYGKHGTYNVDITDIYIHPGYSTIYADGQIEGKTECGYTIYPDHYSDVLCFISSVLNLNESEKLEVGLKRNYHKLLIKHNNLVNEYFEAIRDIVTTYGKENRIVFIPDGFTEEDDIADYDDEFPATLTLWGKSDNPHVDVTEVFISTDGQTIYATGIDTSTGCISNEEFEIYPEQYYGIFCFLATVLRQQGIEV